MLNGNMRLSLKINTVSAAKHNMAFVDIRRLRLSQLRYLQGEYDSHNRTRSRFLYNAPSPQVSSSYVYSFGSYRVEKHTNKQTDAAENIQRSSLRYDVA